MQARVALAHGMPWSKEMTNSRYSNSRPCQGACELYEFGRVGAAGRCVRRAAEHKATLTCALLGHSGTGRAGARRKRARRHNRQWREKGHLHSRVRCAHARKRRKANTGAGSNDLTELYTKTTSKERYTRFWHAQTDCLVRLNALAVTLG